MFKSLSVVFFLLPSVSFADGITEMLIAPYTDPCLEQILSKPEYELQIEGYKFIINFQGDKVSLYDLYIMNREALCGEVIKPEMTIAQMEFIFGKHQPKPIPQLAAVPLPAPVWMLLMGLVSLIYLKVKKKQC